MFYNTFKTNAMTTIKLRHLFLGLFAAAAIAAQADGHLVILHTNDTHSQIDPTDPGDAGGIVRRKVLVDSIRNVRPNVMLIDAGDAVQGTLFFNLYGGTVENKLMDAMGYDLRILGNHEFDNGVNALADKIKDSRSTWLTTNYDVSESPLAGRFEPYVIRKIDGRKIGFIAINLQPKGMISDGNYDGVEYLDAYKAANATAWHLRHNEGCNMVIALTHIGYAPNSTGLSDTDLARRSEDIDIIIGGHSHTVITPGDPKTPCFVDNAVGKPVLVVQSGKSGRFLGEIDIDLGNLKAEYRLIPVDSRLDSHADPQFAELVAPYRAGVDSLMNVSVARSAVPLPADGNALLNFVADYIKTRGNALSEGVDLAIINRGGIRRDLPKGNITEGMVIMAMPFNNRIDVIDIKGSDLLDNFDVMARFGGNGVSDGVDIVFDPENGKCVSVKIDGKPVDPDKTYRLATIDYLANGGDYMEPLTRAKKIAESKSVLYADFLNFLRTNYSKKKINPSDAPRMRPL